MMMYLAKNLAKNLDIFVAVVVVEVDVGRYSTSRRCEGETRKYNRCNEEFILHVPNFSRALLFSRDS